MLPPRRNRRLIRQNGNGLHQLGRAEKDPDRSRSDARCGVCCRDWNATGNVRVQESWPTWATLATTMSNHSSAEGSGSLIVSRATVSLLSSGKIRSSERERIEQGVKLTRHSRLITPRWRERALYWVSRKVRILGLERRHFLAERWDLLSTIMRVTSIIMFAAVSAIFFSRLCVAGRGAIQ